jgi:WD40 repeat protein
LAIGGGKDVELCEIPTGRVLGRLLEHTAPIRCLVWSPDGRQLVSGSDDKTVRLWDIAGRSSRVLGECDTPVTRVAWSPNRTTLAWISNDMITLYDLAVGSVRRTIEVKGQGRLMGLCWAPDGETLAVCHGLMISWWDPASGKRLRDVIPEEGLELYSLAWSPDGGALAVGARGCVRLRDANTGQPLNSQDKCTGIVGALPVWSRDGKTLAIHPAGLRGIWDLPSGTIAGYPTYQQQARGLCRSPDENRLAVVLSSLSFAFYDATFKTRLSTFGEWSAEVVLMAWSPDGQWIASFDLSGTVQIWNATDGQRKARWKVGAPATDFRDMLLWSPDSTRLLTRGEKRTLRVWNAVTGEPVHTLDPAGFPVAWSNDGKQIASCGQEWDIVLWDAKSGRSIRSIPQLSAVHGLAWSAGGDMLKVCSASGTHYCDAEAGTITRTVPIVNDIVISWYVAFSPDQKYAVFRYQDGTVRLLEVDSGRVLRTVVFLPGNQHLVLTDDGHYLGTPGAENEFCYVVMTDQGQELLRPDEFAKKYHWKNDPTKVKLQME